jgi:flagellar hook protein FlgE
MAIIRNEKFNQQGTVVSAEQIDTVAQTFRQETNGVLGPPRALTPAEVDAYITQPAATANKTAIETNLEQDQIAMQAIIDTSNNAIVITTLPQAQQAARDALQRDKDIARNLKRLNRHALEDFDGTT